MNRAFRKNYEPKTLKMVIIIHHVLFVLHGAPKWKLILMLLLALMPTSDSVAFCSPVRSFILKCPNNRKIMCTRGDKWEWVKPRNAINTKCDRSISLLLFGQTNYRSTIRISSCFFRFSHPFRPSLLLRFSDFRHGEKVPHNVQHTGLMLNPVYRLRFVSAHWYRCRFFVFMSLGSLPPPKASEYLWSPKSVCVCAWVYWT